MPTGRTYQANPALQQLPLRTALGRQMQELLRELSPPMTDVDYAAVELRLLSTLKRNVWKKRPKKKSRR